MIKSIKVTNHLGEELLLELFFSERSGFLIEKIEGLGPGTATINTSPYATNDGDQFNSARSEKRNIVISLIFQPQKGQSIETKRHETYKYFPKKKPIVLEIATDERVGIINGYVESNEPIIFSDQCGCVISIICPNPYFYASKINEVDFWGNDPLFEFPFEDPITLSPSVELSSYNTIPQKVITYNGDSGVGLTFDIYLFGRVGNLTIYDVTHGKSLLIDVSKIEATIGSELQRGDMIRLITEVGSKNIIFIRDGVERSVLSSINVMDPLWFELDQGDNLFAITSESHIELVHMIARNKISYEGM